MGESIPFGSRDYLIMVALLLAGRGMDFLSTWVATPNLALEGNPIAKKLGWKLGGVVNLAICITFAHWPLPAIIIATTGFLVAAHNFRSAWLMRLLGEDGYRRWFNDCLYRGGLPLFITCLIGETVLTGIVGLGLVFFSPEDTVPFAIGMGVIAYAVLVLFYTLLSLWRIWRR